MYTIQPKKLLIINILDILKKYTDVNHRLSQKEILELLQKEYSMKADRKAVKRNLMNLIDFGYPISYSESIRTGKNGEEEIIYTDWYMEHDFDDGELRLLIDSLLFLKHIPYSQCRELIKKLEGLSNIYFHAKVKHICTLPENKPANKQLFYTIDVLDESITKKKKVMFEYCSYDVDKQMHPRKREDGTVRQYIVSPYQLAATNGRYYLICNYDKYDDLSNYRVDRISNIKLLDEPVKPVEKVKGLKSGLNLSGHMAEHIYMFAGDSIRVKFRANRYIVNDIIDYFGIDAQFTDITENNLLVAVTVNEEDMFKWAVQYGDHAVVLEPKSLRDKVYTALKQAVEKYEEEE